MRLNSPLLTGAIEDRPLGQFSVRAVDEWIVRDGIVIVLGLDYSRFIGAGGATSFTPRLGIQFDANARTRLKAAYAPGGGEEYTQSVAGFEGTQVVFTESGNRPIAYIDGQAVMERSHRLEFGVERVLDNNSNVEATAFFDTTSGRGVGLLSTPISAFSGTTGEALINVANQEGNSNRSAGGLHTAFEPPLDCICGIFLRSGSAVVSVWPFRAQAKFSAMDFSRLALCNLAQSLIPEPTYAQFCVSRLTQLFLLSTHLPGDWESTIPH